MSGVAVEPQHSPAAFVAAGTAAAAVNSKHLHHVGIRHWILKSDPDFPLRKMEQLKTDWWDGVRNREARNCLRDCLKVGDLCGFYAGGTKKPTLEAVLQVTAAGRPERAQFDKSSPYYDPEATPAAPIWYEVQVTLVRKLLRPVTLGEMKAHGGAGGHLANMVLLRRQRLSVTPVTEAEWEFLMSLAGDAQYYRPISAPVLPPAMAIPPAPYAPSGHSTLPALGSSSSAPIPAAPGTYPSAPLPPAGLPSASSSSASSSLPSATALGAAAASSPYLASSSSSSLSLGASEATSASRGSTSGSSSSSSSSDSEATDSESEVEEEEKAAKRPKSRAKAKAKASRGGRKDAKRKRETGEEDGEQEDEESDVLRPGAAKGKGRGRPKTKRAK